MAGRGTGPHSLVQTVAISMLHHKAPKCGTPKQAQPARRTAKKVLPSRPGLNTAADHGKKSSKPWLPNTRLRDSQHLGKCPPHRSYWTYTNPEPPALHGSTLCEMLVFAKHTLNADGCWLLATFISIRCVLGKYKHLTQTTTAGALQIAEDPPTCSVPSPTEGESTVPETPIVLSKVHRSRNERVSQGAHIPRRPVCVSKVRSFKAAQREFHGPQNPRTLGVTSTLHMAHTTWDTQRVSQGMQNPETLVMVPKACSSQGAHRVSSACSWSPSCFPNVCAQQKLQRHLTLTCGMLEDRLLVWFHAHVQSGPGPGIASSPSTGGTKP